MQDEIANEKESNELMGNHILRPTEDENLVVGMALNNSKASLIPTPPLMLLKYKQVTLHQRVNNGSSPPRSQLTYGGTITIRGSSLNNSASLNIKSSTLGSFSYLEKKNKSFMNFSTYDALNYNLGACKRNNIRVMYYLKNLFICKCFGKKT